MHRSINTLIIFFAVTAAASPAGEEDTPKIIAEVKPDKATVGDQLSYKVRITGKGLKNINLVPPSNREYFPDKKDTVGSEHGKGVWKGSEPDENEERSRDPSQSVPLYIIHSIKKNDHSDEITADITVSVSMSYYRPGTYSLPEIEIKGADGVNIGYKIPTVEITPLNEKGEFQDIEPPVELGGNYTRLLFLILGLIGVAALGFFAYRRFKKMHDVKKQALTLIPPVDIFMNEVNGLGGEDVIDEGRIEDFVFGISLIFRKFLSLQFGFDAIEMTSYEIEKMLTGIFTRQLYDAHFHAIMRSLNLWDLSKFAEFTPSKEALHANLAATVALAKYISEDMSNVESRV